MKTNAILKKETHLIHISASWTKFGIDSYEYINNPWGKYFYIQAGLHWSEIIWISVIYELIRYIEQNKPKINITLIPIANPFWLDSQIMWIQTGYNNIHTNFQNCYNYNRLWEWEWWDFENSIIKILIKLSKKCDTIIDLHSSWYESKEHIYYHKKTDKNVKRFWIKNLIEIEWKFWKLCFDGYNRSRWKESYTIELWASRIVQNNDIINYKNKILWFLWLISLEKNVEYKNWKIKGFLKIFSLFWGILTWYKKVWDNIKSWEKISKIYTKEWIKNIYAEKDSYFLIKNPIHAVYSWQEIAQFLIKT
jgi:hypothetical protein